ncbi:MAG TPA: transmembrane 220 family protein [Cyclobacteriaceae bacterium]|nr:transmembrane 220 family protein [Cyclobacteriaceae bacterium]
MRITNLILAVMFIIFAFVQVNDPDPLIWITIYGLMAASCVMAAFDYYLPKVLIGMAVILGAYAVFYFPGLREWLQHDHKEKLFDNLAKMEFSYIEESREFLGLIICVAVLIMHIYRARVFSGKQSKT